MSKLNRSLAAAAAGTLAVLAVALPAQAATGYHGEGVEVSPTRIELHLNAHGRGTQTFIVANPGSKTVRITTGIAVYAEQATGQMTLTDPKVPGSVSGASWVTTSPDAFLLTPGQERRVTARISEPAHAQPGQRMIALMMTASPLTRAPGQVTAHVSVAGEMIIDTPGTLTHKAAYSLSAPGISFGGPIHVTATLSNTGNAYELLNAQHATAGGGSISLGDVLALAGSTRTVTATWTHPPVVGWETISWHGQTAHVLVLPGTVLLIVLGLLIIVAAYLLFLRKHSRTRRHGSRAHARRPLAAAHGKGGR